MSSMPTLVVIPTYNERHNIADLAKTIIALNDDVSVLVIDDSSPDGTASVVQRLASKTPRVRLILRPSKQGLGSAYREGFGFALRHGFECIVTMDADFSHDPTQLESLIKAALDADVVSRTANEMARGVLGYPIGDWTSGYRCYRRHVLEKLALEEIRSNGYSFLVEMLAACVHSGCRIAEVPITFADRRSGRSKLSRTEIYKGVLTLLRLGLSRAVSRVTREY
jgi:dolichol-phosphate mannosyltransferase